MMDQLTTIDEQINRLKKKKERVQTQQAIAFMREAQKIFQTDFSPDVALSILSETWKTATEKQQAEWKKRGCDFRPSSVQSSAKSLSRLNRHINRAETQRRIIMDKQKITSQELRRARTRQYIQLGALIKKAGLLETFEITLGADLQKDPLMKNPVAALFKGLLELNAMVKAGDIHMQLYATQGLEAFGKLKKNS